MSTQIFSQSNLPSLISGSIIVAEVGADGIVVSSDSRALIKRDNQPYGYFDSTAKIVQVRNLIFGTVGVGAVNGKGILSVASQVDKNPEWNGGIESFVLLFYQTLKQTLSSSEIDLLHENQFVLAGYRDRQPIIFQFTIESLKKNQVNPAPQYYVTQGPALQFLQYDPLLNCTSLAQLAEDGIEKFIATFEMSYIIGGPISSVQIKPDSSVIWLKNKFDDSVDNNIDKLIADGKINLTLVDLKQVERSDSLVNKYLETHPESRRK